ncbi:MAG: TlpA disulfide reductase family protein [Blastocatellia bacterium]
MSKTLKALFQTALLSFVLAMIVAAAAPNLGLADVPELPKPDGSGDTPEIVVDLIPTGASAKAGKFKLSGLHGKVALIDMFWSQCVHCKEHAPHIVALYNEYKDRGFAVLGVAKDSKDKPIEVKNVKDYLASYKINYPAAFITTEVVAYYADSHNHGVPQMVLFGADGKMVWRQISWNAEIEKKLRAMIEEQLAKVPAKPLEKPVEAVPKPAPKSKRG